jgi:hypothetical protein
MNWATIILIAVLTIFAIPGAWVCLVIFCGAFLDDQLDDQQAHERDDLNPQKPLVSAPGLSQSGSPRMSAPRLPHAVQMKRSSMSDSRMSSGPLSAAEARPIYRRSGPAFPEDVRQSLVQGPVS